MTQGQQMTGTDPQGSAHAHPLRPSDPTQLGDWRLTSRWGTGGMGVTYLATGPDGRWALAKAIRPDLAEEADIGARFAREVETLRTLPDTRVPKLLDSDLSGERPYLVMEYVPGPTLAAHVDRYGPLSPAATTGLAADLAATLADLHAAGIVHRDLKPGNVILAHDGPVLIDFGIAATAEATSLTRTGVVVGSPGWLSPEQLTGQDVTAASDVYGWAATITYAATGRAPFGHADQAANVYAVLHSEPDLSGVPAPLVPTLRRGLSKRPEQRPSAATVTSWVRSGVTNLPHSAAAGHGGPDAPTDVRPVVPAPSMSPVTPVTKRRRRGMAAVVAVVLLLGAGAVGLASQTSEPAATTMSPQAAQQDSNRSSSGAPSSAADSVPLPEVTLDCYPEAEGSVPGRVKFDYTYRSHTDEFAMIVSYGDGKSYTSSERPNDVDSAFWHDYASEGTYGPVTATIIDFFGRETVATCESVYVPLGVDSVAAAPAPEIWMSCYAEPDASEPGRVQFDHTYRSYTSDFSVTVHYGDGTSYTSSSRPFDVNSAFWHDYPSAGNYGPVYATITDANGKTTPSDCGTVYVPYGVSDYLY